VAYPDGLESSRIICVGTHSVRSALTGGDLWPPARRQRMDTAADIDDGTTSIF